MTCLACWRSPRRTESIPPPSDELDRGKPGASLEREYERRRRNRETRVREAHPRVGKLILALGGTPQHEAAFHRGDLGEKAVAARLEDLTAGTNTILLHNRRMPRGRGDIDHIAIGPSGVYVIDTKRRKGKVEIRKPWFGAPKLFINRRDCTSLIDGLERQIAAVRTVLEANGRSDVRIRGALCFREADLPWLRTQEMRGHLLLYVKPLAKRLSTQGPLDAAEIEQTARQLAAALPPA